MASYYPYDAIVKKWFSYLTWKRVPKPLVASFLKQEALVKGSTNAPSDNLWSKPHAFYKGKMPGTSDVTLFFLLDDIEILIDIIVAQHPELKRDVLQPGKQKAIPEAAFEEPPTRIVFRSVAELQAMRSGLALTKHTDAFSENKAVYAWMRDSGSGAIMAIDIESWEIDHDYITEIGWSSIAWRASASQNDGGLIISEVRNVEHHIIAEHDCYENGQYSPNNKRHFSFGRSCQTALVDALERLSAHIREFRKAGPLLLVFHNASAEIEYFSKLGFDCKDWTHALPDLPSAGSSSNGRASDLQSRSDATSEQAADRTPTVLQQLLKEMSTADASDQGSSASRNGPTLTQDRGKGESKLEDAETEDAGNTNDKVFIQDTQKIFAGSGLPSAQKQIGLQNALRALDIPCRKLHNAGNDAHYTLAVYEALVGEGKIRAELQEDDRQRSAKKAAQAENPWGDW